MADRFFWLLAGVACGLIAFGDFAYIRDSFDDTASYRFNTVFKLGYQAWFLLAVAAGYGVVQSSKWLRTTRRRSPGCANTPLVPPSWPRRSAPTSAPMAMRASPRSPACRPCSAGQDRPHDPGDRASDVTRLYETPDPDLARKLLERYSVRYVFVGSLERRQYPPAGLQKFAQLGRVAFRSGSTLVYDVGA